MRLIDADKAIEILNEHIAKHDESLIQAGVCKDGENNQIPEWLWNMVVDKTTVCEIEQISPCEDPTKECIGDCFKCKWSGFYKAESKVRNETYN